MQFDGLIAVSHFLLCRLYPPSDPAESLAGKTVLLTGGNTGLGFEATIKFVNLGAESVIIGCRSLERGNKAKEVIEQRTKRSGVVQIWELDMCSFKSVMAFADRVSREIPRLDIALLNAGLLQRDYNVTADGWEEVLQVNTLSTALLGLLLLPKLRASKTDTGPAHLAFVSSESFRTVDPRLVTTEWSLLECLNDKSEFNTFTRYPVTKLLLEYAVKNIARLARTADGKVEVIVCSVCPGFCRSSLFRTYHRGWERLLREVIWGAIARSTEQGSRTLVSSTLQGVESHDKFWTSDRYLE
jgi:NAD(P)-dependent dehydrogenase (short-subunit alcohol dehydrogenase family)